MSEIPTEPLSEDEVALVLDAARVQGHRSGPRDATPAGCTLAFAGMVLLTLTPAVGGFVELSRFVVLLLFGVALFLLLAGAALGMLGRSGSPGGWARDRSEEAVGPVLAWAEAGGDREAALRWATVLVLSGWYADPSGVHATYDAGIMTRRLGSRGASLVRAVEETLLAAGRSGDGTPAPARPIFTGPTGAGSDPLT